MQKTPDRRRGRPRTFDRRALLDAAMPVYWQEGPTAVSLNSICQRTGVSKPSLYREFGNEDGFTLAVLRTYADIVGPHIDGILEETGGFRETLDALAHYASESALSETGCLFVKMRDARASLGPATRAEIDRFEAGTIAAYGDFLARSREAGGWSGCIPVDLGARYLYAQVSLALGRRAAGDDSAETRAVLDLALSVFDDRTRS